MNCARTRSQSEWPEAFQDAIFFVLGRHHCGIGDCCGHVSAEQVQEIRELTANLVGFDEYEARNDGIHHYFWDCWNGPEEEELTTNKKRV